MCATNVAVILILVQTCPSQCSQSLQVMEPIQPIVLFCHESIWIWNIVIALGRSIRWACLDAYEYDAVLSVMGPAAPGHGTNPWRKARARGSGRSTTTLLGREEAPNHACMNAKGCSCAYVRTYVPDSFWNLNLEEIIFIYMAMSCALRRAVQR